MLCAYMEGSVDLIWMCDYEGPLLREVVIQVWDDLNGNIGLSSTRWSHNLEEWSKNGIMSEEIKHFNCRT